MKNITTLIVGSFFSIAAFAQIPNPSFETWNTMSGYSNPAQWGTLNNTTTLASVYTATKGTPGVVGSSYLKITSKTTPAGVANGIAVSGILDSMTMMPKSGFACTQQPKNFTGSWQYMAMGNSAGSISVTLTYWDNMMKMRMPVATANQSLSGMAMSWATFSIPFTYTSSHLPDTCIIFLKASGASPANGDYLWVDNLAFSGSATGVEDHSNTVNDLSVYPNPVGDNLAIDFKLTQSQSVKIQMIDMNGNMVKEVALGTVNSAAKYTMSVEGIAKGEYFINVIANEGTEAKKIIIK